MATTPYEYFLGRRGQRQVEMLEKNEDVSSFFAALLEQMIDYANVEGIAITDLKLDRPFITNDGVIQARLTH